MTTKMMPTTKAGSVETAEQTMVRPRSNQPPGVMAIDRSTGSRWETDWATGIWLKYDVPRLPRIAWDSQSQYWTTSGLSRPSTWLRCATAAGVAASWPRIVAAGSLLDSAPRL